MFLNLTSKIQQLKSIGREKVNLNLKLKALLSLHNLKETQLCYKDIVQIKALIQTINTPKIPEKNTVLYFTEDGHNSSIIEFLQPNNF